MISHAFINALRRILKPMVRLALKHGVSAEQFAVVLDQVYVEIADGEFRLPGRKQSASRVSVLTGINRRAVARIRAELEDEGLTQHAMQSESKHNRAERVVTAWLREPAYLDELGSPRNLPMEGPASFAELVNLFGGDIPHRAVADELLRVNAVTMNGADELQLRARGYVPEPSSEALLHIFGQHGYELLDTIERNIDRGNETPRLYQRRVVNNRIREEDVAEFLEMTARSSQQLLEEYDRWLERHRAPEDHAGTTMRLGFGMYQVNPLPSTTGE